MNEETKAELRTMGLSEHAIDCISKNPDVESFLEYTRALLSSLDETKKRDCIASFNEWTQREFLAENN